MKTEGQINRADWRETFRRNFVHAQGRPPSEEELDVLLEAELAAASCDGTDRIRRKPEESAVGPVNPPMLDGPPVSAVREESGAAMSAADQSDTERALCYAQAHGIASLTEAVIWFAQHRRLSGAPSLKIAAAEFHVAKRCQGLREPTLRGYRDNVGAFADFFGDRELAAVTPKEVADYLMRWKNATTRANRWQYLATFFTWAVRRDYVGSNPVFLAMRKPLRPRSERCIFTPAETKEILHRTKHTPDIGYWALALFAGLRTEEIRWLHHHRDPWSLIRFNTGVVDLRDQPAKAGPRVVPILPALRAWLQWARKHDAPFLPLNHWKTRKRIKREVLAARFGSAVAGSRFVEQPRFYNMARRSYISYRLALPGASYAVVSNDVGNSEHILRKFYVQRATRADAEHYFSLKPSRV